MRNPFFLLSEYRILICYLYENAACNTEEKTKPELEGLCHSLSLRGSHSLRDPDDNPLHFFFFVIRSLSHWKRFDSPETHSCRPLGSLLESMLKDI